MDLAAAAGVTNTKLPVGDGINVQGTMGERERGGGGWTVEAEGWIFSFHTLPLLFE